jgi:hypothetical protein
MAELVFYQNDYICLKNKSAALNIYAYENRLDYLKLKYHFHQNELTDVKYLIPINFLLQ